MRPFAITAVAITCLCLACARAPSPSATSSAPPVTDGPVNALDVNVNPAQARLGPTHLASAAHMFGLHLVVLARGLRADVRFNGTPTLGEAIEATARANELEIAWANDGTGAILWRRAPAERIAAVRAKLASDDPVEVRSGIWDAGDAEDLDVFRAPFDLARTDDVIALECYAASGRGYRFDAVVILDAALAERMLDLAFARGNPLTRSTAIRRAVNTFPRKALRFLRAGLSDPTASVRQAAAGLIHHLDADAASEALKKAFADPAPAVRAAALMMLASCPCPFEERVRIAKEALADPATEVARAAVTTLSQLDPAAYVSHIETALAGKAGSGTDPQSYVDNRDFSRRQAKVLAELALEHADGHMRWRIAEWASRVGGPEGVALLEKALSHGDQNVRGGAVMQALQLDTVDARALAEKVLSDERPSIRQRIATQARHIDDETLFRRVVLPMLDELDPTTAHAAVGALARMHTPEAMARLEALLSDPDARLRASAIGALYELEPAKAIPLYERAASDPSDQVRMAALNALARAKGSDTYGALAEMLSSEDADRRAAVVRALTPWQSGAHKDLIRRAASDADEKVRTAAARKLGHTGSGERSLGLLRKLVADPSSRVRSAAVNVLGRLDGDAGLDLVEAALADDANDVRRTAASAICQGAWTKRRKELLEKLLASDDVDVRRGAMQSLSYFGGRGLRAIILEHLGRETDKNALRSARYAIERRYAGDAEVQAALKEALERKDKPSHPRPRRDELRGQEVF